MSIDFTRPTLSRTILCFLLVWLLFRGREILTAGDAVAAAGGLMMPLERWLTGFFAGHAVWNEIAFFFFTFLNAFYVTRILSQNLICPERTYTPFLLYPLTALGYGTYASTPVVLIVAFLLVFAVDNMIRSHKREENFGAFLHASVALGAAPLLYAPAAVFVLLLPVGFVLFRQNWRSVATALPGYLFPTALCSYILWGMGADFGDTCRQVVAILTAAPDGPLFIFRMEVWDRVLAGIFFGLTVLALIGFGRRRTALRRRALRGHVVFIWTLLFVLGIVALPCRSVDLLPVLAVPLAALLPACFNYKSGWGPNLLYLVTVWSVLLYNLFLLLPHLSWPLI